MTKEHAYHKYTRLAAQWTAARKASGRRSDPFTAEEVGELLLMLFGPLDRAAILGWDVRDDLQEIRNHLNLANNGV